MREQKLTMRFDWEAVVTPAVNYASSRPDVDGDHLALMGMSLGGNLAARAVAFEHRFRAAILLDGVYDLYRTLQGTLPKESLHPPTWTSWRHKTPLQAFLIDKHAPRYDGTPNLKAVWIMTFASAARCRRSRIAMVTSGAR